MNNWSIILSRESLPQLVDYRCLRCGSLFFKVNREVLVLWNGDNYPAREIPLGMGWVNTKCRGCQNMYSVYFQ